jgi:hypothetical protein
MILFVALPGNFVPEIPGIHARVADRKKTATGGSDPSLDLNKLSISILNS